jgi:hypothetical protein
MAGSISGIDWISRMPVSGVHTVTAAEASANKAEIDTGMAGATGFIVQVLRSGIVLGSAKASITAGVLRVEDNASTYVVTTGDVISWIVF